MLNLTKFTAQELNFLGKLNNHVKLQEFIDECQYNKGKRLSPLNILKTKTCDCLEAAVFAHLIFSIHKINSFLVDLRAVQDEDHVLCVFKLNNRYGAIAKSKYLGLSLRHPVYHSLKELVMSYFDHYFNYFGKFTLREYSVPFKLGKYTDKWITEDKIIYKIEGDIDNIKHFKLINKQIESILPRVSKVKFNKEVLIKPKEKSRIGKDYR